MPVSGSTVDIIQENRSERGGGPGSQSFQLLGVLFNLILVNSYVYSLGLCS